MYTDSKFTSKIQSYIIMHKYDHVNAQYTQVFLTIVFIDIVYSQSWWHPSTPLSGHISRRVDKHYPGLVAVTVQEVWLFPFAHFMACLGEKSGQPAPSAETPSQVTPGNAEYGVLWDTMSGYNNNNNNSTYICKEAHNSNTANTGCAPYYLNHYNMNMNIWLSAILNNIPFKMTISGVYW